MKNRQRGTMEELKEQIRQSNKIEVDGKKLAQQSLENYLTETLDMVIVESEDLGSKHSYRDQYKFTAKSKKEGFDAEYLFVGEFYDITEFMPREDVLILKEINGEEGQLKVDEIFYFSKSRAGSNRDHRLLNTPLSELLSGVVEDVEVDFVVNYLKKVFEGKFGYKYTEERRGNASTFSIDFGEKVSIGRGFSNTIQVDFRKDLFQSQQIVFREVTQERIVKEIDQLHAFLQSYFDWNIVVDNKHSLSDLYDFLKSRAYISSVNTGPLMKGELGDYTSLFYSFVIGAYDTYKQIEVEIGYRLNTQAFELSMNYLFNETQTSCHSVDEVKQAIEEMENWLK